MAFTVAATSALSGATVSQLYNWRRTGLLSPEIEPKNPPLLYSFRDIVALRAVALLRKETSLQRIRKAFRHAAEVDLTEHPSQWALVDIGTSIVLQHGDSQIDVVANPGQVLANLGDVMAPFDDVVNLRRPRPHLQVREQRLGGWPTIEGTRVPFDIVARLIADGTIAPEDVPDYYPSVSAEAALDALDFARTLPNWSDELARA